MSASAAARGRDAGALACPPAVCAFCAAPLDPRTARALPGRLVCRVCGAQTTSPWPDDAELDAAYATWYRPPGGRFGTLGDALLRRSRATLAQRVDALAPPGAVLDVGSGNGVLLRAMRRRGRVAVGLERDPDEHDPDVHAGELTGQPGPWAAIVLWHSLEHLRAPGAALDHAAKTLMPGGLLVVAAPNADSLQARAFGGRWFALDLPRHLVHLPAATLTARLRERGLALRRVSHWRGGQVLFGWLHGVVGLLPGRPNLYDAIRSAAARSAPLSPAKRSVTLLGAVALAPVAAVCAAAEVALRRGGTIYVEARR